MGCVRFLFKGCSQRIRSVWRPFCVEFSVLAHFRLCAISNDIAGEKIACASWLTEIRARTSNGMAQGVSEIAANHSQALIHAYIRAAYV
jgi:hypothetical protein